jgi:integrase
MSEPKKNPKTKRWDYVVDLPSADGSRRQAQRRGFKTKQAAQDDQRELLNRHAYGTAVDPSNLSTGLYLTDQFLPTLLGRNLRATTIDSYTRIVTNHLVPSIGTIKLQRLNAGDVQRLSSDLAAKGISAKTRRNVHGVLSKALADAQRWGLVPHNVASGAELPKSEPGAPKVWNAKQLQQFLGHVQEDRLAPLWRFYAVTGCRRGEALGLRWAGVDLDAGTVTFTNQRTLAAGKIVEGPPKTKSGARTIVLDPATVALLRQWRQAQRVEFVRLGVRPAADYVFTGIDSRPLWPQHITAKFRDICDELGLPRIGVHGLRHSAATWLMSEGQNPKVVAQRLGHANSSITIGLYSHVLPAHDRAAAEALAAALDGPS